MDLFCCCGFVLFFHFFINTENREYQVSHNHLYLKELENIKMMHISKLPVCCCTNLNKLKHCYNTKSFKEMY